MRVKLKYALPLTEMVLASALLWWSHLLIKIGMRRCDMPETPPPFDLVIWINVPAALARTFWSRLLHFGLGPVAAFLFDDVAFVAAIGLFWYWVGVNIFSWRQRQTVVMFRWLPLRLGGDALLTAVAVFWCLYGVSKGHYFWQIAPFFWRGQGCFGPMAWWVWLMLLAVALIHLPAPLVMTFLFGRDFLHAVLRKKPASTRLAQE